MDRTILLAWAGLTAVVVLTVVWYRNKRIQQPSVDLEEFFSLALSVFGIVSSAKLLLRVFNEEAFLKLLEADMLH